nr:MAG TPA: hypothetical protein [Caudoviricetes sp.]
MEVKPRNRMFTKTVLSKNCLLRVGQQVFGGF